MKIPWLSNLFGGIFGKKDEKPDDKDADSHRVCGCMYDSRRNKWYRSRNVNGRCVPYGQGYSDQSACEALSDDDAGTQVA